MVIGSPEEVEGNQEARTLGTSSVKRGRWIAFKGSIDVDMGRWRCLLLLPRWLGLLCLSSCLRLSSCLLRGVHKLGLNLSSWLSHWCDWDDNRGWWYWVLDDDC